MGDIGSMHDAQTAAALDNKQNMEQREQYYATVRKPLRSPIHEMATLEKIPGERQDRAVGIERAAVLLKKREKRLEEKKSIERKARTGIALRWIRGRLLPPH